MHRGLAEAIQSFSEGIARSQRPEDRKLATEYIAALAPLLARATLGETILADLPRIERLFGHTWIVDIAPFEEAFARWRAFKAEYVKWVVGGMTVNERLHAMGTLTQFDEARAARDAAGARALLEEAHVDEPSIVEILKGF